MGWSHATIGCSFDGFLDFSGALAFTIVLYITVPIFILSRVFTILYPYWICAYLSYHGLWTEMQLFELVMLGSYIGLQIIILILGIFVFRTHRWLWHIAPGKAHVKYRDIKKMKQ